MIDYHVHTNLCGHASGTMEQYVEAALQCGLDELAFSGHYPYPDEFHDAPENCVIPAGRFGEYLDEARRLRDEYAGRLSIRIGAEFDYLGGYLGFHPMEEARRLELDFCLCSVHIVDGVIIDYTPEELRRRLGRFEGGIERLYSRYWETVLEMCRPGWCTTLGHLDLVKKFSNEPDLRPSRQPDLLIGQVLDAIAKANLVMEINTAGWDKPCAEQYPALSILREAVRRGIALTIGSDAHSPGEVGRKFDRLRGILDDLGVSSLTGFGKLQAYQYQLN